MAYSIVTNPAYPVLGNTIYLSVFTDGYSLPTDGYRTMLITVPDASSLDGYVTLKGNRFIPDVAGVYTVGGIIETTTYRAPKFAGDDASTVRTLSSTITQVVPVGHRMLFPIECLGHKCNLELVTNLSGSTSSVVYSRFVNTNFRDSVMQSYVASSSAQSKLAAFVDTGAGTGSNFYVDVVVETSDLAKEFNDHINLLDIHQMVDGYNTLVPEEVDNLGEACSVLNDMKRKLLDHENNESADFHTVSASQSNLDYIPNASDPRSAYVLLSVLNARYSSHIADATQHSAADTINTHTLGDELSGLIVNFVDYVIDRSIASSGNTFISDIALQNIGFEQATISTVDVEEDTAPIS